MVLAAALRFVERAVGVREEVAVRRAVLGVERDADADGKRQRAAAGLVVVVERREQPPEVALDALLVLRVPQEHEELVAADAAFDVRAAEMASDRTAHLGEHAVAEEMAEVVIDGLEAVRVDEEHRGVVAAGQEALDAVLHLVDGLVLAQEPREAVAVRFRLHALLPELFRLDAAEVAVGHDGDAVVEVFGRRGHPRRRGREQDAAQDRGDGGRAASRSPCASCP